MRRGGLSPALRDTKDGAKVGDKSSETAEPRHAKAGSGSVRGV